jgi:hypothetical protein
MTEKQLADELFNKMYEVFANDEDDHYIGTVNRISKKCAIVLADELSKVSADTDWELVKTEIENIEQPINTEINESSTDI